MLEKQANTVFLGIGSNLGNKKNNINKAKSFLQEKNNLIIEKSSNFYKTKSWPDPKNQNI